MTLTEFLAARLDEASAAIVRWGDHKSKVATVWTGWTDSKPGYTTVATSSGDAWIADGREVTDAQHPQVLFDPERSLREVEAHRLLLDEHRGRHLCEDGMSGAQWSDEIGGWVEDPCAVLRIIATIWSDHPDYKDSWKVGN